MPLNPVVRATGKPKAQFGEYSDPELEHWADACIGEIKDAHIWAQRPVDFSGLDRAEAEVKKRGLEQVAQRIADLRIWVQNQQATKKAATGGRSAP